MIMNRNVSKWTKFGCLFISMALLSACASIAERNPNDPYESYNRSMFKFNEKADQYVMRPVAKSYEKITPKPIRKAVNNFFDNLRDVVSMSSNLLRGDVSKAGYDFMRVAVNTTFGLGGLVNIADEAGIPNHKNTLGDTFAAWGWKNSHYFVYPLTGPSTVRDSVGDTIVTLYPVEKYMIHNKIARSATTVLKGINKRTELLPLTDTLNQIDTMDKYTYVRESFMAKRNHELGIKKQNEDDVDIDELTASDTPTPIEQPVTHTTQTETENQPTNLPSTQSQNTKNYYTLPDEDDTPSE